MDSEILKKANQLNERIIRLSNMKMALNEGKLHEVGFCVTNHGGSSKPNIYKYELSFSHISNTDDNALIVKAGINAIYKQVCSLLDIAKDELEKLK